MSSNGFAFIVGCGHSGTSLVANMFAAHPGVYVPLRETRAFLEEEKLAESWNALLGELAESGKSFFVEKTPKHIRCLDRIRTTIPDSKFIVMVRDGRDVAASFIRRTGSALPGVQRWLEDNRIAANEANADDVILVRYEDLVADPEAMLRTICDFLALPFDDHMLRYHEQERLWFGQNSVTRHRGHTSWGHKARRNWQINQPLFDGRNQWQGQLSEDVLDRFRNGEGSTLMKRFGYDPDAGSA